MKIRYGFVSNSSTTSFCICGRIFEKESFAESYNETHDSKLKLRQILDKLEENGLVTHTSSECDSVFIGLSIEEMKDNETKKEFINRVNVKMSDLIKRDVESYIIVEGWQDY